MLGVVSQISDSGGNRAHNTDANSIPRLSESLVNKSLSIEIKLTWSLMVLRETRLELNLTPWQLKQHTSVKMTH